MIWWCALAVAHPFDGRYVAHELEIQVDATAIEVTYRAELPDGLLDPALGRPGSAAPGDDALLAMTRELAAGLLVVEDGRAVPLERLEAPAPVRGGAHTTRLAVPVRAPLSPNVKRIEVSNANLPDVPAFHAAMVAVDPSWTVLGSSLLAQGDDNGVWRQDEDRRHVILDVTRRDDALAGWGRAVGPDRGATIPIGLALPVPPLAPLLRPVGTPESALAAVSCATLLGALRQRPRWLPGVAGAIGIAIAALLPAEARSWTGGGLGFAVVGLAVARPSWAIPAAILAITASEPWILALHAAVGAGAVALGPWKEPSPRIAAGAAVVAAAILVIRAVG
jgi:hypothetical protein